MKKHLLLFTMILIGFALSAQEKYDKHIFSMNMGFAKLFTKSHSELLINTIDNQEQVERMQNNLHLGFNYDYRLCKYVAVGAKASALIGFHSFEKEVTSQNQTTTKLYSDDINVFYVAPSIKGQLPTIAEKFDLWARLSLGYMNTRITDKAENSSIYSGNCLGYGFELGVDYLFSQHIGISLDVEYLGGEVNTFKTAEEEIDISSNPENLSRLNLSLGVVIKL